MAKVYQQPKIELGLTLSISESEARALLELSKFSGDSIIKVLGEELSPKMVRDNREGFCTFFSTIRIELETVFERLDAARTAFTPIWIRV